MSHMWEAKVIEAWIRSFLEKEIFSEKTVKFPRIHVDIFLLGGIITTRSCTSGGIGRRAGFRFQYLWCVGSTPTSCTLKAEFLMKLGLFFLIIRLLAIKFCQSMAENCCRVKGWQVLGGSMMVFARRAIIDCLYGSTFIETRGSAPNPARVATLNWRLKNLWFRLCWFWWIGLHPCGEHYSRCSKRL